MLEILEAILQTLSANGGAMEYADLLEATPFEHRSRLYDALRYGKSTGVLTKSLIRNEDGSHNHTIALVGGA
jgi:hypothetical protein